MQSTAAHLPSDLTWLLHLVSVYPMLINTHHHYHYCQYIFVLFNNVLHVMFTLLLLKFFLSGCMSFEIYSLHALHMSSLPYLYDCPKSFLFYEYMLLFLYFFYYCFTLITPWSSPVAVMYSSTTNKELMGDLYKLKALEFHFNCSILLPYALLM